MTPEPPVDPAQVLHLRRALEVVEEVEASWARHKAGAPASFSMAAAHAALAAVPAPVWRAARLRTAIEHQDAESCIHGVRWADLGVGAERHRSEWHRPKLVADGEDGPG